MNSTTNRTTTLADLKASDADTNSDNSDAEATALVLANTQTVDADTTITTLVVTSSDSRLPNLSLEDVLERSGVDDNAVVLLQTDSAKLQTAGTIAATGEQPSGLSLPIESEEQLQDAVESIEATGTVVVQVETTNNVQTVKIRAADIDTVYTQATSGADSHLGSNLSNYLLLKNGWAYTNLIESPLDLPLEPANEQPGNGWAAWRSLEDGVHEIQDAITGVWSRLTGQIVDTSPKTPDQVAGAFSNVTNDVQILWTTTNTTTLQLSPEGVFTQTTTSLTTSSDVISDASYALHTVNSASGRKTLFSGSSKINGTLSSALHSPGNLSEIAGDMFGSYKLLEDGITLEMIFADGNVERSLFLRSADEQLTIGGQSYRGNGPVAPDLLENLLRLVMSSNNPDEREKWMKGLVDAARKNAKTVTDIAQTPTGEQIAASA
ncbi:MAG: hypothetical protein AB8B79_21735 [Granulosicoccus sp.]